MKVSAMKTYKDFIIYKGQDKEVQIPFAVSGFTDFTASFYTDKEYEILKTAEDFDFDGEWASIFFDNTALDLLNDGVLRYTFNYKIDGVDVVKSTNSAYTLRTPENYSAHTADEVYQEGVDDQKAKLSSITIVENGTYQAEDGYSAVTVNVSGGSGVNIISTAKTVTQDVETIESEAGTAWSAVSVNAINYGNQRYESGYSSGYTDGMVSGTSVGYDEGVAEQKAKLTAITITENGQYNRPDGYSAVTVNVPTSGTSEPFFGKVADFSNVGFYITDFPATYGFLLEVEFIPTINSGETWAWQEIHVGNTTASTDSNVTYYIDSAYTGHILAANRTLYDCYFNNTVCKFFLNPIDNSYTSIGGGGYRKDSTGIFVPDTIENPQLPSSSVYDYSTICFFLHVNSINRKRYMKSIKITDSNGVITKLIMPRSDGKMWDVIANQESDIDWIKSDGTHPKTFNTLYEWEMV